MNKRLFVGNLSYNTDEAGLRAHFEQIGPVESVKVMSDRETGKARGFGFVEMKTETDASAAIANLNETSLDGRRIAVNEAKPLTDRPPGRRNGGGNRPPVRDRDDDRDDRRGRREPRW